MRRNVSGPPANGFIIPVHAAACVVGRPAGLVLEQANRANAAVSAKIEPMQGSSRNANQVAGIDFDRDHWTLLRMNMEQASSGNDVTDLILIMRMLNIELGKHGVQPGSIRVDVNHIGGDVAALAFEMLDLFAVSVQNLISRSI